MPFDTDKTPKRVIEAAKQRNLVPLVGAGISRQAGDAFPNWTELLKFMKERALPGTLSLRQKQKKWPCF